jgi:hypothetical protein
MSKRSRIKQRTCSSQGQKISLTLLIVAIFFFASTFAQTETTTKDPKIILNIQYIIQKFIEILSRAWVILATLAGKFMTNDMVYGSWLHLDAYLWKLRNICKNFANFGLLGVLLRQIIQFVTKKTGNIQSIVTTSVIAGILIQASWFIMAILLDISTIATAAIGSFPTHFIDNNALSKQTISDEIAKNIKAPIIRFDNAMVPHVEVDKESDAKSIEELIEKITPKSDSVVGPLIYIWASTLRIQNALNNQTDPKLGATVTTSVLQFLLIAIYSVTLILLLVANIIRVWLLRVIIPISPILILMFALGKDGGKDGIAKNFNIPVILNAIFKPVIFTGVLSLILIFIVSMQNMMTTGNNSSFQIQWSTFSSSSWSASIEFNGLSKTTINDSVFTEAGNTGKNIFSNLIIYFSSVFLLRYLVKIAATSGGGTIGDAMSGLTKKFEDAAKLAPVFPVGGGVGWNALQQSGKNLAEWVLSKSPLEMDLEWRWRKGKNKEFEKKISGFFGMLPNRDEYDYKNISRSINASDPNSFFTSTKAIIKEGRQNGLSFSGNSKRKDFLKKWLEKFPEKTRNGIGTYNWEDLDKFLQGEESWWTKRRQTLHKKLIEDGVEHDKNPNSYEEFISTRYGKLEKED